MGANDSEAGDLTMDVVIVSGIWPPDVGGPASHGPDFGAYLLACGHTVRAVTSAGAAGATEPGFPLAAARRDRPRAIRIPAAGAAVLRATRGAGIVYATGMYGRSVAATAINRVPLVLKLVNDPAYERARRLGLFGGSLEAFQAPLPDRRIRALKRGRRAILSRARGLVIPSRYLADIVGGWQLPGARITVVPNPAPAELPATPRAELRERFGFEGPTFVFAGRLVRQKNLPLALAALARVPAAKLVLIGDGPEGAELERLVAERGLGDRISMPGAMPREQALEWVRAADAGLLPSDWENFPHAAVEALAVGTPMIATAVGGVREIVESGVNGIVVAPGDVDALAEAMQTLAGGGETLLKLQEAAAPSAKKFAREAVFASIEAELRVALRSAI